MNITTEQQGELIAALKRSIHERAVGETDLVRARDAGLEQNEQRHQEAARALAEEFKDRRSGTEDEFLTKLSEGRVVYDAERSHHDEEVKHVQDNLKLGATQSRDAAKKAWRLEREHIVKVHAKQKAKHQAAWLEKQAIFQQHQANLQHLQASLQNLLQKRGVEPPEIASEIETSETSDPAESLRRFMDQLEATRTNFRRLLYLPSARFLEDGWPVLLFLLMAAGLAFVGGSTLRFGWIGAACGVIAASAGVWGFCRLLKPWVRRQSERRAANAANAMLDAERLYTSAFESAHGAHRKQLQKNDTERDERILECDRAYHRKQDEVEAEFSARHENEENRLRSDGEAIERKWSQTVKDLGRQYRPQLEQLETQRSARETKLNNQRRTNQHDIQQSFDDGWKQLVAAWQSGQSEFAGGLGAMRDYCEQRFPAWSETDWDSWTPSDMQDLAALRFGSYEVRLEDMPGGLPAHPDLQPTTTNFSAPALLSFPSSPSLLIKTRGEGRRQAVNVLQNVMLRMLTAFPPGKVRFTILDPVGLGQNFSAFMHLADFDERFVTNRIWTEANHMQQRLTDLTEHMENVIQKYLRNEFESIQQYNHHAGEVAEPFQILVVANFPANFSEESARRLASIAASGARCGVYTLISLDEKATLPREFDLADLEANAGVLQWDEDTQQFSWLHDQLRGLPLHLEQPPADELFSRIVKACGSLAKQASRVEVPFAVVAPSNGACWSRDSRSEIEIPLGRAGATKLQSLELGRGTSQHVLISGKTGSGKSTLLHALITNAALYYSPREIELYLIDFKKGVEFKPYASLGLPHARVIAIESEREFGMSVLERLDEELKRRGDLFRNAGVQGLAGFRDSHPDADLPRVLLIIDEFQEFFVRDDKIAQDAALLLDRLVRQGRAFGIHVLLGSQTLAGAYTLARSTIGQMAVRIALQCSEGDAHLILSEENTAARLLNRPGEAIYNDANGRFEGNHPFQVVWLPDEERESYLQQISELIDDSYEDLPPAIVFEGNAPARLSRNLSLRELLDRPAPDTVVAAPLAWLGSAVAIKEPTSIAFRRQSGANLLLVGQQEETAIGVMVAAMLSSIAQQPCLDELRPSIRILDGARPDSPEAGYWRSLASKLPLDIETVRPRDAAQSIATVAAELDRRITENDDTAPLTFLVVHNLSRFRDLKKEEDFSFSFDEDSGPAADKLLATILREGPNFGIHTIIWSDSYNNTTRFLDRGSMRDLELRVLFQMSGNDSANLMDSPAASQLGAHRAILYSDELGESEKFRPYGLPAEEWLDWLKQRLLDRAASIA